MNKKTILKPKDLIKIELNYSDALIIKIALGELLPEAMPELKNRIEFLHNLFNKKIKEYFKNE